MPIFLLRSPSFFFESTGLVSLGSFLGLSLMGVLVSEFGYSIGLRSGVFLSPVELGKKRACWAGGGGAEGEGWRGGGASPPGRVRLDPVGAAVGFLI